MVDVPSARKYGFRLELHGEALREVLNDASVAKLVAERSAVAAETVKTNVRALASGKHAENYVNALIVEDTTSDAYGVPFDGPYSLGPRPMGVVGVPSGRGQDRSAKPPLMVEAQTHALSTVPGFTVGSTGEDIR